MSTTLNTRVKWKRDTSANWTTNNPVLLDGEIIIVDTNAGETRFKVGNGTSTYTQLPFQDEYIQNAITDVDDGLLAHESDTTNPHKVTAQQTGALPLTGGTVTGDINIGNDATIPRIQFLNAGLSVTGYSSPNYCLYAAGTIQANSMDISTAKGMVVAGSGAAQQFGIPEGITLVGAPINVSGQKISLVGEPEISTDAATMGFVQSSLSDYVPNTRTINGKSLSSNISLNASDIGALPTQTGTQGQLLGFTSDNVVGAVDAPTSTSPFNTSYNGTLASGSNNWTASGSQYYQQISLPEITSTQTPIVFPQWTTNVTNEQFAWNGLLNIQSFDGYVRFYASAPTTTNVNFVLMYTNYNSELVELITNGSGTTGTFTPI